MTPQQKVQLRALVEQLDVVQAPPAPPPPEPASVVYFSASGVNSNVGTQVAPKRDLSGFNLGTLPAGTVLRFQAGHVFAMPNIRLFNANVSAANPLVFESFGTGAQPVLSWTGGHGFEFGRNFSDMATHGGYVFRNLRLQGPGSGDNWGFWAKGNISDVTIERCTITGWRIGLNAQGGHFSRRFKIRNNVINNNRDMGIMGCFYDVEIDDNDFSDDVQGSSHFVHRLYLRGGDSLKVRRNRYVTNTYAASGTFTFHGLVDGVLIEDNVLEYGPGSDEGAWVISLIPDTGSSAGGFRNLIIRRNTVQNAGNNAIHVEASPGAIIEENVVKLTAPRYQLAIGFVDDPSSPQNLSGPGIVRNNRAEGPSGSVFGFTAPLGSEVSGNVTTIR